MRTRPPVKREGILNDLRRQIVAGQLSPGAQLPTRSRMEAIYRASRATVQGALDQLVQDGFVNAQGRRGTFVADRPPHTSRYGLVFASRPPAHGEWLRFWAVMHGVAEAMDHEGPRRISIYYGNDKGSGGSCDALSADVKACRLAGLVFASHPGYLDGQAPLEQPGLPRVAVMSNDLPGIAAVNLDSQSYIEKALDYLHARGRRRVAVVFGSHPADFRRRLIAGIAARGMETRPYWTQIVSPNLGEGARNCVHLLMHAGQESRPDGLLVADDNLTEHVVAGLVAAQVCVSVDVDVVMHCNFPWPAASALPVKRLGYDIRQVLRTCLASIDRRRAGEATSSGCHEIPAVFEDELEGAEGPAIADEAVPSAATAASESRR